MSLVTIRTNVPEINALLGRFFRDQIPFATSRAINDVARIAQEKQRKHQRRIFTVRRPQFVDKAVKIKPFASKGSLSATIQIAPLGGAKTRDILTKFEGDRTKGPTRGQHIAIPTRHVPRTAGVVRRAWRPGRLKKRSFRDGFHVFVRQTRRGRAIYFDEGAAGGGIVPLYWLVPRVAIKPNLNLLGNVTKVVDTRFAGRFSFRFDEAVRSAR